MMGIGYDETAKTTASDIRLADIENSLQLT